MPIVGSAGSIVDDSNASSILVTIMTLPMTMQDCPTKNRQSETPSTFGNGQRLLSARLQLGFGGHRDAWHTRVPFFFIPKSNVKFSPPAW